jgi:hypothetical protein
MNQLTDGLIKASHHFILQENLKNEYARIIAVKNE